MKMNKISFARRNCIILLLIFLYTGAFGQLSENKESYNWFFGVNSGMTWKTVQSKTDGSKTLDNLPTPLTGSVMNQHEGCFTVSDYDGNLMFYSDGISIWNKNHALMPNGTGMTGNNDAAQSGIVVPYPGQGNKFIAFTIGSHSQVNRLAYSVIDMNLDGGKGDVDVTQKNINLTGYGSSQICENIATVKMTSEDGFWLVTIGKGSPATIHVWKITRAGVQASCYRTYSLPATLPSGSTEAYLRFSSDGKYFALPSYSSGAGLFFGEFNPATGEFPSLKHMPLFDSYGLEFSISGELLYLSHMWQGMYCYRFEDLLNSSNPSSITPHDVVRMNQIWALQLGPDGRIYGVIQNSTNLVVVDNIEEYGNNTVHVFSGLMSGTGRLGLPNFPAYYFAPVHATSCRGEIATLTASLETAGSITNPVYRWYDAPTGGNWLYTGDTFTTSTILMSDTIFYVSLEGDDYCEGERLAVYVEMVNCSDLLDDYSTTFINKNDTIPVLDNDTYLASCEPGIVPIITSGPFVSGATATVDGRNIVYVPAPYFVGRDSIIYEISCSGGGNTATVYIIVHDLPDNIDDADCFVPFGTFTFTVKQQWNVVGAHQNTGTLVGDLDGDGLPEIIAYSPDLLKIVVHNGQTGAEKASIAIPTAYGGGGWQPHMTALLVDADKNGKAEIIVTKNDLTIMSYEVNTTSGFNLVQKWASAATFQNMGILNSLPQPNVVDFNGDGIPELLVYNRIYNAVTGAYLGMTEANAAAHCGIDKGKPAGTNNSSNFQTAADMDGDGLPEIVAGGKVYKVNFNAAKDAVSCSVIYSKSTVNDGFTAVADIDMDGHLDIVVSYIVGMNTYLDVWSPKSPISIHHTVYTSTTSPAHSFPFVGDIDGYIHAETGKLHPEICIVTARPNSNDGGYVFAYKYTNATTLTQKWRLDTSDRSGGTGITLFDFNNDGINELVYRDETLLRILNGRLDATPTLAGVGASFACESGTAFEYPVIADTDGDGSANICVTCANAYGGPTNYLRVYESASQPWAPTRPVWNQVQYEPLHINNDLTVPRFPISKNTEFNGTYPFNGALIQVPIVDENFNMIAIAPDPAVVDIVVTDLGGGIANICVTIENLGDRNTNTSLPVALYHTDHTAVNRIGSTQPTGILTPGQSTVLCWNNVNIGTRTKLLVRIQDDGTAVYPAAGSYLDCNYSNNELEIINPLIASQMKKEATLISPPLADFNNRGTYPNPVSILGGDTIVYSITAMNANLQLANTTLIIKDTVPAYLRFVPGSNVDNGGAFSNGSTIINSITHDTLTWTFANSVASMDTRTVSFKAIPQPGSVASQPLFINKAWVTASDTLLFSTNSTYHQGAGVSIMTFSAGYGGNIYNAGEQVLDYRSTPKSGIVIAPDEGYRFAGWSHGDYTSLRGVEVKAQDGIMQYDTLIVYGDVELYANFVPEEYAIAYFLNGGENADSNPSVYTVKSGTIALEAPQKEGDTFTGWTGSNGDEPQVSVVISDGSTGELTYYANFLHSGREDVELEEAEGDDKAWSVDDELYVRTNKSNSIVRIYTLSGVLHGQHTIIVSGITTKKLPRGIYIVTINNGVGVKILIE